MKLDSAGFWAQSKKITLTSGSKSPVSWRLGCLDTPTAKSHRYYPAIARDCMNPVVSLSTVGLWPPSC